MHLSKKNMAQNSVWNTSNSALLRLLKNLNEVSIQCSVSDSFSFKDTVNPVQRNCHDGFDHDRAPAFPSGRKFALGQFD